MIVNKIGEIFIPTNLESPEAMTKRYLDLLEAKGLMPKKSTYKPHREKIPHTLDHIRDADEKKEFVKEQIRRWKYGYEKMCGMQYAYYNFFPMKGRSTGMIRPEYRVYDQREFDLVESCVYGRSIEFGSNKGKGIIAVGKRGSGKSSRLGCISLSITHCNAAVNVLLSSKDEKTVQDALLDEKIKFMHNLMPQYLKASTTTDNRDTMYFAKKDGGGLHSSIIARSPTIQSFEGYGGLAWLHDESGKTKSLKDFYARTIKCLLGDDGFSINGMPMLTGVAGEFDKYGTDYIDMWRQAEDYSLINWFIPGWAGMELDKFGNEDIEKAVFRIFSDRIRSFNKSETDGLVAMQQAPLTPEEALLTSGSTVLPKDKIIYQSKELSNAGRIAKTGMFDWVIHGQHSKWTPIKDGKVELIEHPARIGAGMNRNYIGFIDCYDFQGKKSEGSKGAMYIFKRKQQLSDFEQQKIIAEINEADTLQDKMNCYLRLGHLPVLEYIDDQDDPRDFANECAKAFMYYQCITMVERLPSPIITYLLDYYKNWIQYKPLPPQQRYLKQKDLVERGIKFDDTWKEYRTSELRNYYTDYYQRIFFERQLIDAASYDPTVQRSKHDSVDALGGVLLHDKQDLLLNYHFNPNKDVKAAQMWGFRSSAQGIKSTI